MRSRDERTERDELPVPHWPLVVRDALGQTIKELFPIPTENDMKNTTVNYAAQQRRDTQVLRHVSHGSATPTVRVVACQPPRATRPLVVTAGQPVSRRR